MIFVPIQAVRQIWQYSNGKSVISVRFNRVSMSVNVLSAVEILVTVFQSDGKIYNVWFQSIGEEITVSYIYQPNASRAISNSSDLSKSLPTAMNIFKKLLNAYKNIQKMSLKTLNIVSSRIICGIHHQHKPFSVLIL